MARLIFGVCHRLSGAGRPGAVVRRTWGGSAGVGVTPDQVMHFYLYSNAQHACAWARMQGRSAVVEHWGARGHMEPGMQPHLCSFAPKGGGEPRPAGY
ncbi:hypothetical protein HK26_02905 [Acetobacter okinawensis]|uniref:Uncharacterized protein n=1 Tax=Acetobacter okinawensis TaxID=1076594 RepID=A0A252BTT3_9PROT|nr:hypothetical protein HK26_02905 [Acetobacter okinawensis]